MARVSIRIEGMFCENCPRVVKRALESVAGVENVEVVGDVATIVSSAPVDLEAAFAAVRDAGYLTDARHVLDRSQPQPAQGRKLRAIGLFAGLVAVIVLLGLAVNALFGFNVFNAIPVIDDSLTLPALFTTGILTSLHCLTMCGAINLTATSGAGTAAGLPAPGSASGADTAPARDRGPRARLGAAPVLYNLGRLASYTLVGAIVGALGSVVVLNAAVGAAIVTIAAALMVALSLRMAGIVSFRLPTDRLGERTRRSASGTGIPLVVGLANGLMPCGPLQAVQLYALATGSAGAGALSMMVFCLGTMPLMLGVGYAGRLLTGRGRIAFGRVAAAFMFVLAASMLLRGLALGGVNVPGFLQLDGRAGFATATVVDGVQTVRLELDFDSYGDFEVQAGVPVRLVIDADAGKITGCNNEVVLGEWGVSKKLGPGENVLEFTPRETGEFVYTCWMGMISNTVRVVD